MDRRKFIRTAAVGSLVSMVDFSSLNSALASGNAVVSQAGTDIVAVMGGSPEVMLDKMLAAFGGIGKFVKKGQKVVIKPNIGWDRAPELAADTNPQLVGALVKKCVQAGAKEVLVFDHTCNNWQKCYENSGISDAVEKAGGKMIPAHNEEYYTQVSLPKGVALKDAKIHKSLLECDVWFNMPVLKHHGGAKMTASMKNYMGIVWDRSIFHRKDLQQCIADIVTFHKKPALHIVDAYRVIKSNGPQGKSIEDTATLKSLIASPDPVAADAASLKLFSQVRDITLDDASHLKNGEKLKLGTTQIEKLNIKRIKI